MNRKIFASVVTVLTGFFLYSSCTKVDSTDLGNDLIPAVDNVHTFETQLDVVTDNFLYPDTTRIGYGDLMALGLIGNDLEFGATSADIYTAFRSSLGAKVYPFINRDSVIIDSVVLSLAYSTVYGDTNSIQTVEVTQLDNASTNFKDSTTYLISHAPFVTTGAVRGSKTYALKDLNDSLTYVNNGVDTIRAANQLRIKLDTAFARQFVNYVDSVEYKNDSAFITNFRGLAIKMSNGSPTKNGLAYFDLSNEATRMTVYCRVTKDAKVDTISPYFLAYGAQTANLVKRTPGNNYQTYLTNGNPSDDKVYLASAPGSYGTIQIKGLDTFKTINRVIHRAELIMEKVTSSQEETYGPVPTTFLDVVNETGDSTFTIRGDFSYVTSGAPYYDVANLGGTYTKGKYIFNLTRYMQGGVSKGLKLHKTLRVYAPVYTWPYFESPDGQIITANTRPYLWVNQPIAFGRVVLGGGTHPTQKMKVRIIYSKL